MLMKKILSILIVFLYGVNLMSLHAREKMTVNVYALGEFISEATNATTYGGGTVEVCVASPTNIATGGLGGATYGDYTCDGPATKASAEGKAKYEYLGGAGIKYTIKATADEQSGYYFHGWTETNSLTGNLFVTEASPAAVETGYPDWGRDITYNFYAIFFKWRWGYGFPCTVHAIG